MVGLIGRKLGMTQIFDESGNIVPVTIVEAGPCPIVQVRNENRDGYRAVQLAFVETNEKRLNKPRRGHLAKHGVKPHKVMREFRFTGDSEYKSGEVLTVEQFEPGTHVDVVGTSKGKGFQGVVKRHGFAGGPASHGSKTGNLPGSIGNSADPARVFKGTKLPGQTGSARVTAPNLVVVKVDTDRNLVLIRGAVPGGPNSIVFIRPAYKAARAKARAAAK